MGAVGAVIVLFVAATAVATILLLPVTGAIRALLVHFHALLVIHWGRRRQKLYPALERVAYRVQLVHSRGIRVLGVV